MPYQIIYSSESSTPMEAEELEEILEHARRGNARSGITGALVYVDGVFLQLLEGEKDRVQSLMQKISKDVRHETVTVLKAGDIPAAAFAEWTMAYLSATPEQVAKWAGLSATAALPEVLNSIRQDSHKTARVAEGILAVLVAQPATQTGAT